LELIESPKQRQKVKDPLLRDDLLQMKEVLEEFLRKLN
jgi:hypothetical protein